MRKLSITILTIIVVTVLFFTLCTFKKRVYEDVVLDRFGKLIDKPTPIAYGWYLCLPIDKVVRLDTRLHLYQGGLRQISVGSEPLMIKIFAAWKIVDPVRFYRTFGGSDIEAQNFIDTQITSLTSTLGDCKISDIFNVNENMVKIQTIEEKVRDDATRHMSEQGIALAEVGFARMAFPPSVVQSVYESMSAGRAKVAAEAISEGDAKATDLRAQGASQAEKIRAEADAYAAATRGQGESEAIKILAAAQTPESRDFYRFWRSLELFKASLGKGTYVVLSPDDPIVAPLFQGPNAAGGKVHTDAKSK